MHLSVDDHFSQDLDNPVGCCTAELRPRATVPTISEKARTVYQLVNTCHKDTAFFDGMLGSTGRGAQSACPTTVDSSRWKAACNGCHLW